MKVVILDAGHGGLIGGEYQTAGKRSPVWADGSQYFEGVGNRDIVKRITEGLIGEDILVFNSFLGENDLPIKDRIKSINGYAKEYGVKNCLCISVHSDGYTKESAHGYSAYTYFGLTDADKYAEWFLQEMEKQFPNQKLRTSFQKLRGKEKNLGICRETSCPTFLTENFFQTNEKECKTILMTEEGRQKIANAHINLIKRFIECN